MPHCSQCNYYSDRSSNLKKHERTHSKERTQAKRNGTDKWKAYSCLLCSETVRSRDGIIQHFTSVHGIVIAKSELVFVDELSFFAWKSQVEKATKSRFVQRRGILKFKDHKTVYYYCHRDGIFSPGGRGERRLKQKGSNKIDTCCPARITATTDHDSGAVHVIFVETHVGHSHDLGRLYLSKSERKEIADKINAGMKFKDILDDLKNSVRNNDESFVHLLKSKDLWNIQQEFNLKNGSSLEKNECGVVGYHHDDQQMGEENDGDVIDHEILNDLSQNPGLSSLESKKRQIMEEFQAALDYASNMDELDLCETAVSALIPTIEDIRSTSEDVTSRSPTSRSNMSTFESSELHQTRERKNKPSQQACATTKHYEVEIYTTMTS